MVSCLPAASPNCWICIAQETYLGSLYRPFAILMIPDEMKRKKGVNLILPRLMWRWSPQRPVSQKIWWMYWRGQEYLRQPEIQTTWFEDVVVGSVEERPDDLPRRLRPRYSQRKLCV